MGGEVMPAWNPQAPPGHQYPSQRTAQDPWLTAILEAGREFWRARGVDTGPIDLDVANYIGEGAAGAGLTPSVYGQSRVVMNGGEVGKRLAVARNKKYSVRGRRRNLQKLADYVFHEVGHVGGLSHSADGLMSPYGGDEIPWDARVLSRKLVRRPKAKGGKHYG